MHLVKIDNIYINVDRVDGLSAFCIDENTTRTNIFVGGSQRPSVVKKNIDEVAAIINGIRSEENK